MAERASFGAVQLARPVVTIGRSVIDDSYYVEVTPDLQRERAFQARQGALAHAGRLRDLYGWRVLDLTLSLTDAA
jgi:hypothetical protein